MRYRMEMLDNEVVVRNVEMDLIMGWVSFYSKRDPHDPSRWVDAGCIVRDDGGERMAAGFERALPPKAVGFYEENYGYPHFKPLAEAPERNRVEHLLGKMVADLVCQLLQMLIEQAGGRVTLETKKNFHDLLEKLLDFWDVSHFGSWNAERGVYEPYFADPKPENPRLNFGAAVRAYGLIELRKRFPQESDATLQRLLWWPIEMMDRALKATYPKPAPNAERLAAAALSTIRQQVQSVGA